MPTILQASFPRVRNDRGDAAAPLSQPGPSTGIRTRIWPWYAHPSVANVRTTVISPPFTGPVMIYEIAFRRSPASNNAGGLSFFWATDDGGGQTNGPIASRPSGTPILDQASVRSALETDIDTVAEHIPMITNDAIDIPVVYMRPRFIIEKADKIFLKASAQSTNTGGNVQHGWLVVIEARTVEELVNFP